MKNSREKQNEVLRQLMEEHKAKLKNSKSEVSEPSTEKLTTIELKSKISASKKKDSIQKKVDLISNEEFFNAFQKPKEELPKTYLSTSPVVNFIHKVSQTIKNVSSNKKKKVKNLWSK